MQAIKADQGDRFLRDQRGDYFHGTFHFMIDAGLSRALATMFLGLDRFDASHFQDFLTFLVSIAACFSLAIRLHRQI